MFRPKLKQCSRNFSSFVPFLGFGINLVPNRQHCGMSTKFWGDFVQFGNVRVDFSTQEALRDDSPVFLTSMEFKTLKFFVANPYRVISRDELLNEVWGYDSYPCTRTVDNRILRLRQKLEVDSANPEHFLTVYGAGYKFVP